LDIEPTVSTLCSFWKI